MGKQKILGQNDDKILRSTSHKNENDVQKLPIFTLQDGRILQARSLPSPHFDTRPNEKDISLLIIHYISLPPEEFGQTFIDDFFLGKLSPTAHPYFAHLEGVRVSSHCLINRQGQVTQYVNFNQRAWHAGKSCFQGREKCNDFSIGIELIGSNHQPFTPNQYTSLVALTKTIQQAYPAITKDRIVGHCHIAPERKVDPGQYFDWVYFLGQLSNSY